MDHIQAISAVKDANMELDLNLTTHLANGEVQLTCIRPDSRPGRLLDMIKELPWIPNAEEAEGFLALNRVLVFSSSDGTMSLNVFTFGKSQAGIGSGNVNNNNNSSNNHMLAEGGGEVSSHVPVDVAKAGEHILEYAASVQRGEFFDSDRDPQPSALFEQDSLVEFMKRWEEKRLVTADPRRFLRQRELFEEVSGTDGMDVHIDKADSTGTYLWVDMAVANSLPQVTLENAARVLSNEGFDIDRTHMDIISDGDHGTVTFLRTRVSSCFNDDDEKVIATKTQLDRVARKLKRVKWLDPSTVDLAFDTHRSLGLSRSEVITAFCSLTHAIMAKQNAIVYSKANIFETVTRKAYMKYLERIATLFLTRFDPVDPMSTEVMEQHMNDMRKEMEHDIEDSLTVEIFEKMLDIVKYTLRTNMYLEDRYSLGLRLDPRVMVAEGVKGETERELPYGVVFAHGRRFNAFHVRFRNIARGGLRLVTPHSPEQQALESARQYDECYSLAAAQQMKNKDIPEGGSKAVCLIDLTRASHTTAGKNFIMRKSVKAFTDTILDLIVETEETKAKVVDYLGKKEVIYLGPDEQVVPEDINWVVARAAKRGYGTPAAFMSSKPRAGINHKVYGVTSEGVNVFLEVALKRALGKDPRKESFSIKMTGGPNGDVAGNELKILFREYGDNAKIVGMADHSGSAEDPEGLDHEELLRLVQADLPIGEFDASKLGATGNLHLADTEEGAKMRNSMHSRVEADAFIPAGGRPNTIDIHNYRHFLKEDGKTPSAPLIVEAANIFITQEARDALYEQAGVLIVKDSSANKCGVICSSYEICAAMLLSEAEFFDNKEVIVAEVLVKLRHLAELEAELLFREYETHAGSLIERSQIISSTINVTKDALIEALEQVSQEDRDSLMPLFRAHLPPTVADMAFDRVHERVPEQYIKNAIASGLASKMVYKEGTSFMQSLDEMTLAETALRYVKNEKRIAALRESLSGVDMPEAEKNEIISLLDAGGARTMLNLKEIK
jgi:glutamate dehydrogenase